MSEFTYTGIVTGLSLLVYYYTLYQSGMARGRFGGASTVTRRARGLSALRSGAPEYARAPGLIRAVALVVRAGGRPFLGRRDWGVLAHRQASLRVGLLSGAFEANAGIDDEHAAYLYFCIRVSDWVLLGPLQRLNLS